LECSSVEFGKLKKIKFSNMFEEGAERRSKLISTFKKVAKLLFYFILRLSCFNFILNIFEYHQNFAFFLTSTFLFLNLFKIANCMVNNNQSQDNNSKRLSDEAAEGASPSKRRRSSNESAEVESEQEAVQLRQDSLNNNLANRPTGEEMRLPVTGMPTFGNSLSESDSLISSSSPALDSSVYKPIESLRLQSGNEEITEIPIPSLPNNTASVTVQADLITENVALSVAEAASAVVSTISVTGVMRQLGMPTKSAAAVGIAVGAGTLANTPAGKLVISTAVTKALELQQCSLTEDLSEPAEEFTGELRGKNIIVQGRNTSDTDSQEARSVTINQPQPSAEPNTEDTLTGDPTGSNFMIPSATESVLDDGPMLLIESGIQLTVFLLFSIFFNDYKTTLRNGAIFIRDKYSSRLGNILLFTLEHPIITHGFPVRFILGVGIILIFGALIKYI
jgi:hypothetical protein